MKNFFDENQSSDFFLKLIVLPAALAIGYLLMFVLKISGIRWRLLEISGGLVLLLLLLAGIYFCFSKFGKPLDLKLAKIHGWLTVIPACLFLFFEMTFILYRLDVWYTSTFNPLSGSNVTWYFEYGDNLAYLLIGLFLVAQLVFVWNVLRTIFSQNHHFENP